MPSDSATSAPIHTANKPLSAQAHSATFTSRQRTLALIVAALAFVMDLLDTTITNIAIPSIRTNLSASYSAIQWITAGYSLAFALLLVTGGRMGDVFGYKKIFMFGVAGFTVASLLSGVAVNPDMLIAARFLQGSMSALMVPQVLSLMQVMYKPEERGAINGLFGAMGGLAASLGPVIGGLLIKANIFGLDWRPIFLINVPVGLFALLAGLKFLPDGKSEHPLKLDIRGTLILMVGLLLLVYPLIQGRELGWPLWSYIMMVASIPVLFAFAKWQQHKERTDGSPLILPSMFKRSSFGLGLAVNLLFEGALIGFFLTFALFLQIGIGFSPIKAALTGLPLAVGISVIMATLGEKVIPRLGRRAMYIGTSLMALGFVVNRLTLHHYVLTIHPWQLIPGLLIIGVGMGMIFGSLFGAVLNGVDPKHAGSASGALNAMQQIGGAVGVAIIGVIFFGQLSSAAATSFAAVQPGLQIQLTAAHIPAQSQSALLAGVKQCFVDRSTEKDASVTPKSCQLPVGEKTNTQLSSSIETAALQANRVNFDNAFKWTTVYEIVLLAVTFIVATFLPKTFQVDPAVEQA
jgi:EmrB/QacA subfamily drug resistance transporter